MTQTVAPPGRGLLLRVAVYGFLLILLVVPMTGVELWPVTSLRLFSQVRAATSTSWRLVAVDPAGTEHPIALSNLPRPYRHTSHILARMPSMSAEERATLCNALTDATHEDHLRVYRAVRERRPSSNSTSPAHATLLYDCART